MSGRRMIDLHLHLLPGVDDGPDSFDEAVEMCTEAAADGCTALVATPHQRHDLWWNGDVPRLERLRSELQSRVDDALDGALQVLLGGEVRVGEGILEAVREGAGEGVCTLGGSRYVLIELSRFVPDPDPAGLVHELLLADRTPVIAHLEEIGWLAEQVPLVERLVERGATVQVTGGSILGRKGRRIQRAALDLLDAGLVHYLASDAHNLDTRPPGLSEARAAVADRWGEEVATLLTETNPSAVIQDQPLPTPTHTT